jgi:carbon storage regulator
VARNWLKLVSAMLVLSRRQNETVIIGDNIVVTVLSISSNQVRLGIQAPPEVRVLRGNIKTHNEPTGTKHDPPVSKEAQHRYRKK